MATTGATPAGYTGDSVLLAQITALERNIETMKKVLANDQVRYGEGIVSGKFLSVINPILKKLADIRRDLTAGAVNPAGVVIRIDARQGWERYMEASKDARRVFNQCLDYIGGIAIRKWNLEANACDLAEKLVRQYVNLGANWMSVTIVGEERLFDNVAQATQIIRLRFPEWDIWSLPFASYEFGMWVAGETLISGLKEFLEEERQKISDLITGAVQAPAEVRLATEIAKMRKMHEDGNLSDAALKDFLALQEMHMKELFADAFATYFLGPAYLYARIWLRVNPMEALQEHSHGPSTERRVGLMLRILEFMDAKSKASTARDTGVYEKEIKRLTDLWKQTIRAVQADYEPTFAFGQPYDGWHDHFREMLESTYTGTGGFRPEDWEQAEELGRQGMEGELPEGHSLPVMLNAAWHCWSRDRNRTLAIGEKVTAAMLKTAESGAGQSPRVSRPRGGRQTISGR